MNFFASPFCFILCALLIFTDFALSTLSSPKAYDMRHMSAMFYLFLSLKQVILVAYAVYLVLLSIIAFLAYHSDKKKAKEGEYRIKESVLLSLSLLGGAFGGYPAMLIFRHKTKGEHWYFTFVNLLGIALHMSLLLLLIFVFNF